jgi:hypothetical protein
MWLSATKEQIMGRLIWNGSGNLAELINSPTSFLTGANIRRKDPKKKPKEEPQAPAKGDDSKRK